MEQEGLKIGGVFSIYLNDKLVRQQHNVFLNTGKTWAIVRLFDDAGSVSVSGTAAHCFYVGNTASGVAASATATDTTAHTEELGRMAFTYNSGATVGRMSATATFGTGTAVGSITEAGIFAGGVTSGDGAFIARTIFTAVSKGTDDILTVKYDITIS